ncbi:MAG TPA: histidine--tRNA ligase [Anaerohalosphaeraceae bacterium]|nr:histidine--tRNA ligase [Anaerohalosphaeraceae bacterium]HOL89774.1 histidine--tRNA ligase [Anaerohalosphaeraceae bacterium]HPP57319.1 histidine--tRNA ligase [Anaerohalosphaeraceae bacterium]
MKIPAVKGTRDFYPPQMAVRNFIVEGWKAASRRSGFEEYDGPIFEYLSMYQMKSGEEIVEQLFSLTDRGGRQLAIRPEMTPTLARMVNQQIHTLPRPIKWFSVPRLCRAERPQKGRLREFFQWNLDIVGAEDVLADAEVIFCAVDYLRSTGLTAQDIVVRLSSRRLLAALLKEAGASEEQLAAIYGVLDKKAKVPAEAFEAMLQGAVPSDQTRGRILQIMNSQSLDELEPKTSEGKDAMEELRRLFSLLNLMGIGDYAQFDIGVVRGLAYYTGVVYEIYDRGALLRAICGGGRYDNLLKDFGGPAVSATGMGMGDCVLEILLREKGLLKDENLPTRRLDYYVVFAAEQWASEVVRLAAQIRLAGWACDFSYKGGNLGKQLKQADQSGAERAVILGEEFNAGKLIVKEMKSGRQEEVSTDEFLASLKRV